LTTTEFSSPPADFSPPDISAFRDGNRGVDYVTTFDSQQPGPHLLLNAVTHGNEYCGAAALVALTAMNVRPKRGKLTLVFANVAAYRAFSPTAPYANRYLDDDFNRIWLDEAIDAPRFSSEIARARVLRPIYAEADVLLDLHSMSNDAAPLLLCGRTRRGRRLAQRLGYPMWTVADNGHRAGRRLIDYGDFADRDGERTALLVECGQHWNPASADVALETCLRLLKVYSMLERGAAAEHIQRRVGQSRFVEVTQAVTARTDRFTFCENFIGLEIIRHAGTVIGFDGDAAVATPYDNCVLVMPTRHVYTGQTAVRFGRITPW
jgi:predicted deacylase